MYGFERNVQILELTARPQHNTALVLTIWALKMHNTGVSMKHDCDQATDA
jgi:hypothetical protein